MGHTMSIHSQNDEVILQFGLKKPAFRICVNTPTTHGSIGLTTGLDPAMTLGCGGPGGNITSDNISPRHLLNLKRLAYEVRPAVASSRRADLGKASATVPQTKAASAPLPKVPAASAPKTISAQALAARIDTFLASRGYKPPEGDLTTSQDDGTATRADNPAEFIFEDDVRAALRSGRKLLVGERTIITPAARDLGESEKVFQHAGWPR